MNNAAYYRLTVRAQLLVDRCATKAACNRAIGHVRYMLDVAQARDLTEALYARLSEVG